QQSRGTCEFFAHKFFSGVFRFEYSRGRLIHLTRFRVKRIVLRDILLQFERRPNRLGPISDRPADSRSSRYTGYFSLLGRYGRSRVPPTGYRPSALLPSACALMSIGEGKRTRIR